MDRGQAMAINFAMTADHHGHAEIRRPCCREALGGEECVALAGIGITVAFEPGQTIVVEGDPITHYFRILAGTVRLYNAIADGRRQVIDFLGEGECFGLTGLERHAYSVEAIGRVTMVRYPRQQVEAAMQANPMLARRLFELACAELRQAQRQMLLLGRKSAEEKIASFLVMLAEHADGDDEAANVINIPMSRQDMADYLGLTIETVSRTISRFKHRGLIALAGRQHVAVCAPDRLKALADGEGHRLLA
jgi:CRP/FNR family transcriptional regulator